ncbi:MAG TPA: transposase [Actinomycetota bacterium]|nr:transposase [Actinomycetota bacterium]
MAQLRTRRHAAEAARREQAARERAYQQAAEAAAAAGSAMRPGRPPKNADVVRVAQARLDRRRAGARARHAEWATRAGRTRAQGRVPRGRPPVPVENQRGVPEARAAYQAARAEAVEQAQSGGTGGDGSAGGTARTEAAERLSVNLTDPDSRLLKTRNGWVQGYNCQTAVSEDEFVVSARATQDANDVEQFVPTVDDLTATAERLTHRTGRDDLTVGTMVGDAGYHSQTNLDAEGPDRLIADAKRHMIDQRAATEPATGDPPADASPRQKMNHRLRTPQGHSLYKRRAPTVEGPNAWLKDRRGLRRFARRGLDAAQAELSFACAVTNLLKLATKAVTATRFQTG